MRNKKKIFAILAFFVLLGGGVIVYLAGQGNKPSKIQPVGTELPQTEPTQEVLFTTKPSITGVQGITKPAELLPTVTMLPVPTTVSIVTNTPIPTIVSAVTTTSVPTMALTVTNTPVPTIIPIISNIPIITDIPTITDTPLPIITNAIRYTPTPIIPEGTTPEYMFQMGDDVWFKYYENSDILVVAGTGATWDFKDFSERWKILKKYDPGYDYAKKIFIEEGIVRIGDYSLGGLRNAKQVVLPDTLQEIGTYAFAFTGANNKETEWINLNLSELKTECN